jgi:hypothetical protein
MFTKPLLGWQNYTQILYATIEYSNIIFSVQYTEYSYIVNLQPTKSKHVCVILHCKGVGMIRVDVGPISETVYIDLILNTIIER